MKLHGWFILAIIITAAGCNQLPVSTQTATSVMTPTLKQPSISTTKVPDPDIAVDSYFSAWIEDDYSSMYKSLTSISRDAISEEDFTSYYKSIATEAALESIDYEILSALILNPKTAQVNYRLTLHSVLVGDLQRDLVMNLSLENGQWQIQWDDTLVLPELAGENYLGMERYIPSRANIYDRNGHALVAQADATAIGLIPDQIDPDQEETLFTELYRLLGLRGDNIRSQYENFPPGVDWYLPLGEVTADEVAQRYNVLSGLSGLLLSPYKARYYFENGIAPHVVGYVSPIQAGEEEEYLRRGYRIDERVGQSGMEWWGEEYLSGTRGGALYVFDSQGKPITRLAEVEAQPSQAIYTTIEKDFQIGAQRALTGYRGAIVVIESETGRVLAMVSSPGFDPNAFEPSNYNYNTMLTEIFEDPATPTFNRAAQGQYPLGSIFKIITMAAALESGQYTPETEYECGYLFKELSGRTLHDWTYDHYLEDGKTIPSGTLTLPEGLIRSCNPYFWHIGLDFYNQGMTTTISSMADGFGLGIPTEIDGIDEADGLIPIPENQVDATNLAIGQGKTLVTPLQVAKFIAAIGNGGTLYKPQLIEKIAPPDGDPVLSFQVEEAGNLPVSEENLKVIQNAMVGVVKSTQPYGTAWHRFTGLDIPVAGKTGTATSGYGEPHAWFTGYTFAEREDLPDIAIAVVVENIGEGSDYAAPIFRRIVELYFYGKPQKLYPWEATYYVTRTPTPEETETPEP